MSPNRREREYEKRRYEKWQAKQAERLARRRRNRRVSMSVVAGIAVAAIVTGVFLLFRGDDKGDTAAATPSPSAANPCPAPTVKAPSQPKKFAKAPPASAAQGKQWRLTMKTTCGDVVIQLDGAKAPQAVSVLKLLGTSSFWNGSPCHRLTTEGIFVLQCGDPTGTGSGGPGFEFGPVENAPKGDTYVTGTVAMARRGGDGKSMGSQFFLVYKDSQIPSDSAGGYTVVGKIVSGLDVVQKVAAGGVSGGSGDGAPQRAVSIVSSSVTAQ